MSIDLRLCVVASVFRMVNSLRRRRRGRVNGRRVEFGQQRSRSGWLEDIVPRF
jgi:hypothetical protein